MWKSDAVLILDLGFVPDDVVKGIIGKGVLIYSSSTERQQLFQDTGASR